MFDVGSPGPAQVLRGHTGQVCSVQMDKWKVVSGRLVSHHLCPGEACFCADILETIFY